MMISNNKVKKRVYIDIKRVAIQSGFSFTGRKLVGITQVVLSAIIYVGTVE